jgi:hypothetical protein
VISIGNCPRTVQAARAMRILPLLFLILTAPLLRAQQATPPPTNIRMWRCNLPGGSYSVALRSIVSVSSHEYVVEGAVRVTEVNIDTNGNALARFYYLEPNGPNAPAGVGALTLEKAQQLVQEATERTGQDVWKKVVKNYPTTTHAHTIEYRVEDKAVLTRLYESAESALRLNQNSVFNSK